MNRIPLPPDRPPPGLTILEGSLPAGYIADSGPARLPIPQSSDYRTIVPFRPDAAAVEPPAHVQVETAPGKLNPRE
eukprot:7213449-Karenia_brevis.AAC.1